MMGHNLAPTVSIIIFTILAPASNSGTLSSDHAEIPDTRIVGGTEAPAHIYPSIVNMLYWGNFRCGGTIINSEWVLSAAHCFRNGEEQSDFGFMAGDHNRYEQEGSEQSVDVLDIKIHPQYRPSSKHNDIALFKVYPPFEFNKKVKTATLPPKGYNPKGKIFVAGWGATTFGGSVTIILQHVQVNIIDTSKCDKWYTGKDIISTQICAGYEEGGKDSCQGDSGGPLYDITGGKQIIIGVTSFGRKCALKSFPGVYTRVSEYRDWITQTIKNG